jgi:hypothetical protein
MVEGKTLTTFRDIVLIVGMLVLCFFEMQAYAMRIQAQREQAVRFALARNAVVQLDDAYKKLLAGKPATEQIFRQNEILLEYQKLLLTIAYAPAAAAATLPPQPVAKKP